MKMLVRGAVATFALSLSLLGPAAGSASASTLYGITFNNQLITIDPTTGAGSLVGNLDSSMSGYGLAVLAGNLYTYDQNTDRIQRIDPTTGHTLASITINAGNLVGEGDLAFRSDGIGFLSTGGLPNTPLLTYNIAASTSSQVSTEPFLLDGLAFNSSDVLYGMSQAVSGSGTSQLYTINQTTGALSLIGGLNIPSASTEILGGLTFAPNGTLFAELSDGSTTSVLATVNTSTGQATTIGTITGFGNVSGIAFLGDTAAPVPEPATLLLVGAGLVGAGWRKRSARRSAASKTTRLQ